MDSFPKRGSFWVIVWLLVVMLVSITLERPGLTWMNDYGVKADQSFNNDDDRFIEAARDFKNPYVNRQGYPEAMTTQLYVATQVYKKLFNAEPYYSTALRLIVLLYAQLAVVITYLLARRLGLSTSGAVLSTFLLVVSPQFVVLANQGTPDIPILSLFYATILVGMYAQRTGSRWAFYACCGLAGIAMATKFFLPVLVPVALLIIGFGLKRGVENVFLAGCVSLTAFCTASYFGYTPWDFMRLIDMLIYDNLIFVDGNTPLEQVARYIWDVPATAGIVTASLALLFILMRVTGGLPRWRGYLKATGVQGVARAGWGWLVSPSAMLVLPLLTLTVLIVTAQVHFTRHILIFLPLICIAAASLVAECVNVAASRGALMRNAAILPVAAMTAGTVVDAALTEYPYNHDIRMEVVKTLVTNPEPTSTVDFYSNVRETVLVEHPTSERFVTCDMDYARYLKNRDARKVVHPIGGQERVDFYHALFAGKTPYRPVQIFERKRLALEDRLADGGWIPSLDAFYPSKCILFSRQPALVSASTSMDVAGKRS